MSEQLEHDQNSSFKERSKKLQAWFQEPARGLLLKAEQHCIDHHLKNIFGHYACQMSAVSHLNLLEKSSVKYQFKLVVDVERYPLTMLCDPYFWPVESGSLDVVLLHHVLEIAESPHRLLSQAAASIIPDGKLLIIGFNPCSMANISRWFIPERANVFKGCNFIQINRLKDWLTLLGFSVEEVSYGAYFHSFEWLFKGVLQHCIEPYCGQRQLPLGCFYSILAIRDVYGVSPIKKPWLKVHNQLIGYPAA
ncbi:MAG: hypothetical protein PUP46_05175 [Endozoicomonas sp. (ex Botrylloides leachii)]|nr:hypothetical protein [Endozoicomonas sp. (ex Botrylloides leachii)]